MNIENLQHKKFKKITEQFYKLMFKHIDPKKGTTIENIPEIVDRIIKKKMNCDQLK